MNKKILNIITSLVLLLAFFMPWVSAFGLGGSPYQMMQQVFKNLDQVDRNPEILYTLIFLVFPVCALIVLIIYAKSEIKKGQIGLLHLVKKAPLIILIIAIIYGLVELGESAEVVLDSFSEVVGIGLILTVISSIVLFIDQPKVQAFVAKENNEIQDNSKEEANTDDLFN